MFPGFDFISSPAKQPPLCFSPHQILRFFKKKGKRGLFFLFFSRGEYIKGKEFVIYILYIENSFHILYTPLSCPLPLSLF